MPLRISQDAPAREKPKTAALAIRLRRRPSFREKIAFIRRQMSGELPLIGSAGPLPLRGWKRMTRFTARPIK
jgi:hypothetical protein